MRANTFAIGGVFILSFLALGALPARAQGVGAIGGSVADASGGVLPGVTVTLNSAEGTVGGRQETTTDERGAYQFVRLVPGTYVVKAELGGFRPAEQRGVARHHKSLRAGSQVADLQRVFGRDPAAVPPEHRAVGGLHASRNAA